MPAERAAGCLYARHSAHQLSGRRIVAAHTCACICVHTHIYIHTCIYTYIYMPYTYLMGAKTAYGCQGSKAPC